MSEVTQILSAIERGDTKAADQLLPLVYDELRKLAAQRLAQEKPGQTLDATALVHEAYMRLVASGDSSAARDTMWSGRGHFIAAAAEAMRRILVENARRKKTDKRGGGRKRIDLTQAEPLTHADPDVIMDLDAAITALAEEDSDAAAVAKLRFVVGWLGGGPPRALPTARANPYRKGPYARAWLHPRLGNDPPTS